MATKTKKKHPHIHLWDMPKHYFPRNSDAINYRNDVLQITRSLNYVNTRVQHNAQICAFNIKAITQTNGYNASPRETFETVEAFVYHYENYCFRVYAFREKLLQFLNSVLQIGYDEREVAIKHIIINPVIRVAKVLPLLETFNKPKGVLKKLIKDRNSLTHKLYYGKDFDYLLRPTKDIDPHHFKEWCGDWKSQIVSRAKEINKAERLISEMNNHLAQKIIDYKDSLKTV